MTTLWSRSSHKDSKDWTPVAGNTPTEIASNFAATVNTAGMSEADLLAAWLEEAEFWSDDPQEQMAYLIGLKNGMGL